MTAMTKKERLEHTRSLLAANPICRLYDRMGRMKKCPKCEKLKSLTEFYPYNTGGNTHTYWCKVCIEHYIEHTSVGAN